MKYPRIFNSLTSLIILSTGFTFVHASPTLFTIDEAQSKITIAGSVLGNALSEQGPGSLTTTFYGTIVADVSANAIQFPGGSSLTARTNGVWSPGPNGAAGSAPADYAAKASTFLGSVKGALRNLLLDMTTAGALPMTNGVFNASSLLFAFPTNSTASFDYDAGFLGAKGIALTGLSTNKIIQGASVTSSAAGQTLTIPVDAEFKFKAAVDNDSSVRLTGHLVAVSGGSTGPNISSITYSNQTVTVVVQGAGSAPRLDSTPDLVKWTTQNPTIATSSNGVVLTLPATNRWQFYRAAKP